jgi:hypothetical protein
MDKDSMCHLPGAGSPCGRLRERQGSDRWQIHKREGKRTAIALRRDEIEFVGFLGGIDKQHLHLAGEIDVYVAVPFSHGGQIKAISILIL